MYMEWSLHFLENHAHMIKECFWFYKRSVVYQDDLSAHRVEQGRLTMSTELLAILLNFTTNKHCIKQVKNNPAALVAMLKERYRLM